MPSSATSMLDHALAYAKLGLPIIPLHGILSDGSCSCGRENCHSPGKHPRTPRGLKDATTDSKQIKKWWGPSRWPNANIGGVGGRFLCLDIDAKSDGFETLERLIESHAPLPDTAVAATGEFEGTRGRHYWYRVPEDHETPGSRAGVRQGIDLRCAGGYAVLPPSIHASGVHYEWEAGELSQATEAPAWILDLAPEFIAGESAWTPNSSFRMSKQVKQFLSGDLEVPIGEQRDFLVVAARSILTTGRDVETTATLLWEGSDGQGGIEACPWEERDPWTPEDIYALVSDIYAKPPTSPLEKDFTSDDFTFDDRGNAKRLIASFKKGHILYVPELGHWYIWDESKEHFQSVDEGWLRLRWSEITEELAKQARQSRDEATEKALRTHAKNSNMRPRIEAAVTLARDEVCIHENDLDTDPMKLGVVNGVVDLRTGKLEKDVPENRITKRSPVAYDPDAYSDLFETFLEHVIPDEELREYVQIVCGYSLTGSTDEHAFFYLYGQPGTGKTTFVEALKNVMGSYAKTTDTSTFLREARRNTGATPDLARLARTRLVTTSEIEQNERLAVGLVSQITGGDMIAARMLYGKPFEYRPQFKLWIAANELPRIVSTRSGIWRRVKILSFDEPVSKEQRDPTLAHKFREPETASAILAWMVEGAVKWSKQHSDGKMLKEPGSVTEHVEEYKRESDHVIAFIEEAIEVTSDEKDRVPVTSMYQHYRHWCDVEGRERREQQKALARKLRDAGLVAKPAQVEDRVQRCWIGVRLKELSGGHGIKIKGSSS